MTGPLDSQQSRSPLTDSVRRWLLDDGGDVLFYVTHWQGRGFTGRTFYLAPLTGEQR